MAGLLLYPPRVMAGASRIQLPRPHVLILMYHRLAGESALYTTAVDTFRNQLLILAERDYQSISVEQLVSFGQGWGDIPSRSVLLTFDDNYLEAMQSLAIPTLQQVARETGIHYQLIWAVVSGSRDWSLFSDESFAWMRQMERDGWLDVQSHSTSHQRMTELLDRPDELLYQFEESRLTLNEKLSGPVSVDRGDGAGEVIEHWQKTVEAFVLPFGEGADRLDLMAAAVQSGFECVFAGGPLLHDREVMRRGGSLLPVGRLAAGGGTGLATGAALADLLDEIAERELYSLEESLLARKLFIPDL